MTLTKEGTIIGMKKEKISSAVIRRLPRYYRHLSDLAQSGVVRISSSALGEAMNLTASQIRHGYNVTNLRDEVANILGMSQMHTAIVMGAGNLGRALIENFRFDLSGFHLTAAFDTDPELIGREIAGTPVYSVDKLEEYLAQNPVSVGVLTVPQNVANSISEQLIAGGVKGIWNFTNSELQISDPRVVVENIHFADSLLALSYWISEVP